MEQFGSMRDSIDDIQDENGLFFAVYVKTDNKAYPNDVAASHLEDSEHIDGNAGNYWSGTHPAFSTSHGMPVTAVIDVQTGEVLASDTNGDMLSVDDVMDAVEQANSD